MKSFIHRNRVWIVMAAVVVLMPIFFRSSQFLTMLSQMGIAIIFALSYNLLLGQCGLLSFGHAVFFGLGAYFTVHALLLMNHHQLWVPTPLLPLVGGFFGLGVGLIIGLLTTRRPGATFAMISLGINEMIAASALMFYDFFGSEHGISAKREAWLSFRFHSQLEVYYLIFLWVFICALLIYAFTLTPLGRIANAIRDNPERAQFICYNPVRVRALVVAISGFFAGISGGLYALNWELVTYECIGILQSAFVLFMVFIGGVGFFFGPILGAILVTFLTFYLSAFTEAWLFYLGAIFIIMVLFAPAGIAGILFSPKPAWEKRAFRRLFSSYLMAILPALLLSLSAISVVEIVYRWSASGYAKSAMKVYGITFDANSFFPWAIALAGLFWGSFFFWRSLDRVKTLREQVSQEAKSQGVDDSPNQ